MADSVTFKAGDTFSYIAEIPVELLDTNRTWGARAWVRDLGSWKTVPPLIDTLACTLTAPIEDGDDYVLLLEKSGGASGTGLWPRPSGPDTTRRLVVDIEFFDDSATPVIKSTSNFYIEIDFDPTRPA